MTETDQFHLMLSLLVFGFILLGTGFSFRDKGWGVALMLFGSAVLLVTVGARILEAVSLS
ncbi:hypothetical protein BN1049_01250 [Pseudomonas saudimassiliensis]|uniref:Uncharacterized protein n=1 Tax=Pseudomonas saudimassiliensis TaxID=1461581 RepID=A0A078MGP2_9PSED|nr:hypothetical protein [Pseudomonas saudimassiliensis]CEA03831.1 hypothetical protein BN1049_01250 [Pseudomonas saudimassiliensis]CEF26321.1 hypothetical protein BN1049_01250 [Pseudomonas saudimassiliensis]